MSNRVTGESDMRGVGSWRLINRVVEVQGTGERLSPPWNGRMIIQPDGKFMILMTLAGRTTPVTEEDRAVAFASVFAGSGTSVLTADMGLSTYELASNPQALGALQTTVTFIDAQLRIAGEWAPSPAQGGHIARTVTEWERESA